MRSTILFYALVFNYFYSVAQVNPVSLEWINENLEKAQPRLIFTKSLEEKVKLRITKDALVKDYYALMILKADAILDEPPLTYQKHGRRLLSQSREAIRRMLTLALVFRLEEKENYLKRLEDELEAVCSFPNWNPSHFLDVAEMATAVAFTLDWCGDNLNSDLKSKAQKTLVDYALKPALAVTNNNWWVEVHHNWNLVCHGGLSMAALTVFEQEPELASAVLHRAIEKVPLGLLPYAPDGIYPEGPSYWGYATNYLALMLTSFQSALNTDFGFNKAEGLMLSAEVTHYIAGPSGKYFNFFDAGVGGYQNLQHFGLLTWFKQKGGDSFNEALLHTKIKEQLKNPEVNTRFLALYFLYLCNSEGITQQANISFNWVGKGENPIGVFRPTVEDGLYLAAKGGRAGDNHGNMDAGSFILEWQKERFGIDLGNQDYKDLEDVMGSTGLWDESQMSPRWDLLTKNNFGHSTLTINALRHNVDARAELVEQELLLKTPYFTFDLSPLYGGYIKKALRTYSKESENRINVRDELTFAPATQQISWQMITQADVEVKGKEVVLTQNSKKLRLQVENQEQFKINVVSLSPPPLPFDKKVEELKRIDIIFERNAFQTNQANINILIEGIL